MANKANYHLLATSRSELRAPSTEQFSSPPSHFVTAPWGALGTGFPRPLASLRTACAFLFTPQSLRDSPLGGTGDRIPQTPCVASLRVRRLLSEHIPPSYEAEGGHGCKEVIIGFGSILVIHLLII